MDTCSQETLRKIEQNDAALKILWIGSFFVRKKYDGAFNSSNSEDYSRLGAAIGNNTHFTALGVADFDESSLTVTNSEFFDGLKQNMSIRALCLDCRNRIIAGGVVYEILKAYQEKNNHLTSIRITRARLQNGGDDIIANTLRRCTNLEEFLVWRSNTTDAQLLPIVDAIRGNNKLKKLHLDKNNIGNAGCEAIATLLEDPSCNLRSLELAHNQIGDAGATILANSLSGNNKLQKLYLHDNSINRIDGIFCGVLCNTSSINSTYSSNHTLIKVVKPISGIGPQLVSLLKMNKDANKSYVAMKKILKYHPNIDMKQLFEWDAEDGEQNLKALPYVVDWFDRAKVAVAAITKVDDEDDGDSSADSDDEEESYNIDGKKLSAIFQFAMAMPLLLVPASHVKADSKKRKMSNM